MTNKVYALKIADRDLATILQALAELPFKKVQAIVTSLGTQMAEQNKPVEPPLDGEQPAPGVTPNGVLQ